MEIVILMFLGLIQGLCEFLPISSSGHILLLSRIFGINSSLFVSVILHAATLLSILVVLRKDVWQVFKKPFSKNGLNIIFATIPTCIIALILMPLIDAFFSEGKITLFFLLSATLLLICQYFSQKAHKTHEIGIKDAIIIGISQGFATFPGLSRSGTTISAGILSGAKKEDVAKFSFMLSIPIIILSILLEVYKIVKQGQTVSVNILGLILAFFVAFIVGVFSIKAMIKLTSKSSFKPFCIYLIFISIISIFI